MTGMVTAFWISSILPGSAIRATPPCLRMSAGTRSSAITATAPASSAILACSALITSMITPPLSISARPLLTRSVPFSTKPSPLVTTRLYRSWSFSLSERGAVFGAVGGQYVAPVEARRPHLASGGENLTHSPVVDELDERLSETGDITHREVASGVLGNVDEGTQVGGDHRGPRCHCLHQRDPERLPAGMWGDEHRR